MPGRAGVQFATYPPSARAVDLRSAVMVDRFGRGVRLCSRTGCSEGAAVTLSYHYGRSQVWLDELWDERDPHAYDLCERHAARLSVPTGWTLDDRRRHDDHHLIAV
jgi:hypothetical protein